MEMTFVYLLLIPVIFIIVQYGLKKLSETGRLLVHLVALSLAAAGLYAQPEPGLLIIMLLLCISAIIRVLAVNGVLKSPAWRKLYG
jgi:hypothetical protein